MLMSMSISIPAAAVVVVVVNAADVVDVIGVVDDVVAAAALWELHLMSIRECDSNCLYF